ncbi:MAG: PKD domain-containing protein [Bacteroidia bacterium]
MNATKTYLKLLLPLFLIFLSVSVNATHIVGGELTYRCLGNNNYEIKLKIYRDCLNGMAPFDDPANITIFNSSGGVVQTIQISNPVITTIPPSINSPCFQVPSGVCVEEGVYTTTINLPPLAGGYTLAYQRCCRNNTIININSPGNVGSTYTAHIPDPGLATCNSNPRFNYFPPIFVCAGVPLSFNHSATDLDGDSLVYELCDAYEGATPQNPMPTVVSPAPPFGSVPYSGSFTGTYPMTSNPPLSINPQTGLLTGTPTQIGQFVVAVCVSEYRNGQLLSVGRRDFQFNVVNCPYYVDAIITPQFQLTNGNYCNGLTYTFLNQSVGGTNYLWDFGIINSNNDTSTAFQPTFTFPDTGTYTITLIVNPGPCADTTTQTFTIYKEFFPSFTAPNGEQCLTGNSWNFNVSGQYEPYATFHWNFGPATPPTATGASVNNVSFNTPGNHVVTLIATQNICTDTLRDTITVVPDAIAQIALQDTFCNGFTYNFLNQSQHANSYYWDFGDPTTTNDVSTLFQTGYTYPDSGIYTVTLIAYGPTCADTTTEIFRIYPLLRPIILGDTAACIDNNNFTFTAGGVYGPDVQFDWFFGPNANISTSNLQIVPNVIFSQVGTENVILCMAENGCYKCDTLQVRLYPRIASDFYSLARQGCVPLTVKFSELAVAQTPLYYTWNFGDGNYSNEETPIHTYTQPGVYTVSLTSFTTSGCLDTITITKPNYITVFPKPTAGLKIEPTEVSIFEPNVTFFNQSTDAYNSLLYFGDGDSIVLTDNYTHTYADTGNYVATLIVTNENGCTDTITGLLRVNPEYRIFIPNAFTPYNNDGLNDTFIPVMMGIKWFNMKIFDRWGELIFETDNPEQGWDGTFKGAKPKQDVYVYLVDVINVFGKRESFTGHVTLIR